MKLKLPPSVASVQDLTSLTIEMREYSKWYAHEEIKKRVDAKHTSPAPVLSKSASELLREWKSIQKIDRQSLDLLITTLEDYGKKATNITITLAAAPSSGIKTSLVAWCRENLAPDIMVSFQFNATLLGGLVVRHGSHVYDWSFRRQILAARNTFPEVLRSV
jgi:hypothetical protein